eukprot:758784-Hanusia_phi.AAC.9
MIKRIVQASRKFAYLPCMHSYQVDLRRTPRSRILIYIGQATVGDVGVIAELSEVEFLPDGRAHVQAKCRDRFRIVDTWIEDGTQGLHWCKVEIIHDEPVDAPADNANNHANGNEQASQGDSNVQEEQQDQEEAAVQAQTTQSLEECARECSQMFEAMMENFGNMRSDIDVAHGPKPENPEVSCNLGDHGIFSTPVISEIVLLACFDLASTLPSEAQPADFKVDYGGCTKIKEPEPGSSEQHPGVLDDDVSTHDRINLLAFFQHWALELSQQREMNRDKETAM